MGFSRTKERLVLIRLEAPSTPPLASNLACRRLQEQIHGHQQLVLGGGGLGWWPGIDRG